MFQINRNNGSLSAEMSSDLTLMENFIQLIEKEYDELNSSLLFAVKVCLRELILNAIDHGNQGQYERSILIKTSIDSDSLKISVSDEGEGWDHQQYEWNQKVDMQNDRNRGLFLVNQYADHLDFNESGSEVFVYLNKDKESQCVYHQEINQLHLKGVIGGADLLTFKSSLQLFISNDNSLKPIATIQCQNLKEMDSMALGVLLSFGNQIKKSHPHIKIKILGLAADLRYLFELVQANSFYEIERA